MMGPIFGKLKKFGVWAPGTHDDNRPFLRIKNHRILMTSIIIMTHAANARRCKLGFVGPNMEIVLFGLHQANKKGPFSMEPIPRVKDPKRCGSFGRNHSCDKSTSCDAAAFETDMVPTRGSSVCTKTELRRNPVLGCWVTLQKWEIPAISWM